MTDFSRILNELQYCKDRQGYIDKLCRCDLLIIDDLGAERDSAYATEQVFSVIDRRYKMMRPVIITTNLSYNEILNCTDCDRRRIYDRIMEMCHPIQVKGGQPTAEYIKKQAFGDE